MNWTWKNTVGVGAIALTVWFILFVAEWGARTKGKVDRGDAFFSWLGDLVMLGWVERYQTLLAAFVALLGGASVYYTTVVQRNWNRNDTIEARSEDTIVSITQVRLGFQRLFDTLLRGTGRLSISRAAMGPWQEELTGIESAIVASRHLGAMSDVLLFLTREIREAAESEEPTAAGRPQEVAAALSAVGLYYLMNAHELVGPSGRIKHRRLPMKATLASILDSLNVEIGQLRVVFPVVGELIEP